MNCRLLVVGAAIFCCIRAYAQSPTPTPIQRDFVTWISDGSQANVQWIHDNCANVDPIPPACLPYLAPSPTASPSPTPTPISGSPEIVGVFVDGQPFVDGFRVTANVAHTFAALANANTQSVKFQRSGGGSVTDNTEPYQWTFTPTVIGTHSMSHTPWSLDGATGEQGQTVTRSYEVIQSTPTPTPTP